jgi:uncharacterized protein
MPDERCSLPPFPEPTTDLDTVRRLAEEREERYLRFRAFLKQRLDWSEARLDRVVHEIARSVQEAVDCTACANCCSTMRLRVYPGDAPRLARHLRLPEAEFEERYLAVTREGEKMVAGSPCPFLDGLRCSAYAVRPRDCRSFPHLLKSGFRTRALSVLTNAGECPIVFNTLERLMLAVGYR